MWKNTLRLRGGLVERRRALHSDSTETEGMQHTSLSAALAAVDDYVETSGGKRGDETGGVCHVIQSWYWGNTVTCCSHDTDMILSRDAVIILI